MTSDEIISTRTWCSGGVSLSAHNSHGLGGSVLTLMYIMATQEDGKNPSAGDSPEWVMVVLHVKCVFAVDDAVPYITLMKWLPSTVREVWMEW